MYQIAVKVKGLAPVAFNRPSDTLRTEIAEGKGGGRRTEEESFTEAEARIYTNGQGVFMPSRWFKKCMLQGASLSKIKYKGTGIGQYLDGAVLIQEREILVGKESYEFMYGRWGRVPPRTGALVWLQTPALNEGWEAAFTFVVFDNAVSPSYVQAALATGGAYKGVGNNRPEFGRFEVTEFEVKDYEAPDPNEEDDEEDDNESEA